MPRMYVRSHSFSCVLSQYVDDTSCSAAFYYRSDVFILNGGKAYSVALEWFDGGFKPTSNKVKFLGITVGLILRFWLTLLWIKKQDIVGKIIVLKSSSFYFACALACLRYGIVFWVNSASSKCLLWWYGWNTIF